MDEGGELRKVLLRRPCAPPNPLPLYIVVVVQADM